jgi:hypothetical protein
MAALARQVERTRFGIERHAEIDQPVDRVRRALDDIFDRLAPVEPRARDHGVADMVLERIAGIEHGGDPALRPCGRAAGQRTLGEHQHPQLFGKRERGGQPGRAGPDDDDVMAIVYVGIPHDTLMAGRHQRCKHLRRLRGQACVVSETNTSSRSGSRVVTSSIA